MAMKRKLKWLAAVLAVLLLGFGTALFLWPRDRITQAAWQKIRIGMTEKEVEHILGGPGISVEEYLHIQGFWLGTDRMPVGEGIILDEPERTDAVIAQITEAKVWFGRRGYLEVQFDNKGQARWKYWMGWRLNDPTFIERMRDWLGW